MVYFEYLLQCQCTTNSSLSSNSDAKCYLSGRPLTEVFRGMAWSPALYPWGHGDRKPVSEKPFWTMGTSGSSCLKGRTLLITGAGFEASGSPSPCVPHGEMAPM